MLQHVWQLVEAPLKFVAQELYGRIPLLLVVVASLVIYLIVQALRLTGKARTPNAPHGDATSNVDLRPFETNIRSSRFLSTMASTSFLIFWPLGLFLIAISVAIVVEQVKTPKLGATDVPFLLLVIFAGPLLLWLSFQWSRAISRARNVKAMWYSIVVGILAIVFGGGTIIKSSAEFADLLSGMGALLSLLIIGANILAISFGFRLMRDGVMLARSGLTIGSKGWESTQDGKGEAVARALGVHPICQWLRPREWRWFVSFMFVCATISLACTVLLTVNAMFRTIPQEITGILVRRCHTVPFAYNCFGGLLWTWPGPILSFCAFVLFRQMAHRLGRVSLEQLIASDQRAPVLFLRSFKDDQVQLPKAKRPLWHRLLDIGDNLGTLDRVLVQEASRLGPAIAIGMPGHPPSFGVARTYLGDADWQAAVKEFAAKARAIVIVIDETPGLLWELTYIRDAGYNTKTLFLIPPALASSGAAARIINTDMPTALLDVQHESTRKQPNDICIGWHTFSESTTCLTTDRPSRFSYISAIRQMVHALER